jgi:phosphotransferase system enzyme I (PtsP)
MGLGDLPLQHLDAQALVIDGYAGRVYVNPGETIRTQFNDLAKQEEKLTEILESMKGQPSITPDGSRVTLYSNSSLIQDITPALLAGAEGVGLYRTELPFMLRERFPSEEEQRSIYRHVLEQFAPKPVVLRTLDIGGEKPLPYFPINEPNPSLGWRGIRISLDHPEIFLAQVRAAIRANIGLGNMRLLLPMISDLQELEAALALIHQAHDELVADGVAAEMPRVGTMIEVPSAVFLTEEFARRVDFISVGTNDLTQYMLAADRGNPRVAGLLDTLHPAVLHALSEIAAAGRRADKMVYVCGEAAADPCVALLLVGMGISALSMGVGDLPRIRWVIRTFSKKEAQALLSRALKESQAAPIRALLNDALDEAGLGGLVRAGN